MPARNIYIFYAFLYRIPDARGAELRGVRPDHAPVRPQGHVQGELRAAPAQGTHPYKNLY